MRLKFESHVVICFKIRIFVVQSTSGSDNLQYKAELWFALKFVSLWCNRHLASLRQHTAQVVICFKIRIFVVQSTSGSMRHTCAWQLWFALKFVSLWCNRHQTRQILWWRTVVICFKIRIFVVQSTSKQLWAYMHGQLWFALKFVSLWCNRHH